LCFLTIETSIGLIGCFVLLTIDLFLYYFDMLKLEAHQFIDTETQAHYAFHNFTESVFSVLHCHDFYEIFLVVRGSIIHHINQQDIILQEGALVFIRPDDEHAYRKVEEQDCQLINLAFWSQNIEALFAYLQPEFSLDTLLKLKDPPTVYLSQTEKNYVQTRLEALNRLQNKLDVRVAMRVLLAELVSQYILTNIASTPLTEIPLWLQQVCASMNEPPNFIEGRSALLRLAQRSEEHIGRVFKQYLGVTPSKFINDLRLEYASKLLLHTDHEIIDITFQVGFQNLSHFYHLFQNRWQTSPHQFRKKHRKQLIP
jgi:AraC family transcriptional regulator, dual regulator of chb operon